MAAIVCNFCHPYIAGNMIDSVTNWKTLHVKRKAESESPLSVYGFIMHASSVGRTIYYTHRANERTQASGRISMIYDLREGVVSLLNRRIEAYRVVGIDDIVLKDNGRYRV